MRESGFMSQFPEFMKHPDARRLTINGKLGRKLELPRSGTERAAAGSLIPEPVCAVCRDVHPCPSDRKHRVAIDASSRTLQPIQADATKPRNDRIGRISGAATLFA